MLHQLNFIWGQKEGLTYWERNSPAAALFCHHLAFKINNNSFHSEKINISLHHRMLRCGNLLVHHICKLFWKVQEGKSQKLPHYSFLSPALQGLLSVRFLLSCFFCTLKKIMVIKNYSRRVFLALSEYLYRSCWPFFTASVSSLNYDCWFQHSLKVYLCKKKKRIVIILPFLSWQQSWEEKWK